MQPSVTSLPVGAIDRDCSTLSVLLIMESHWERCWEGIIRKMEQVVSVEILLEPRTAGLTGGPHLSNDCKTTFMKQLSPRSLNLDGLITGSSDKDTMSD